MNKSTIRRDAVLHRALALMEKIPFVDGHNDLPWVIRNDPIAKGDVIAYDLTREHQDGDTDIPRLLAGRVGAQIWAAFIPSDIDHPARATLEQIDVILRMHEAHPDVFLPATKAADIRRAKRIGKIASIIAVEGGVGLENSLSPLRVWHAAGARLMTLCHSGTLDWVDSATDEPRHGGLTAFGRAVVQELNRLGMIVDCAHVSPEVMRQVLEISTAPIVFSHSNARAICDHVRNVPDDVLAQLRTNNGMVMATFIPDFVNEQVRQWMIPVREALKNDFGHSRVAIMEARERETGPRPRATLGDVADMIERLVERIGLTRIGIGSDFFGVPTTPVGLEDASRFPHLLAELFVRGWSEQAVAGLAGLNFLRVSRAVEAEGKRLRRSERPIVGRAEDLDPPTSESATAEPLSERAMTVVQEPASGA
ncbi:MAG TPA: dipeptidase [Acetobacteraceae bacterium]|nr:dipeptidase [Acetobacteraceae bacterium]